MKLQLIKVDYCTLPEQLLPAMKEQSRVEFTRDDDFFKTALARAISEIEAQTNLSIFEAHWRVADISACDNNASGWIQLPKTPVCRITDASGADLTVQLVCQQGGLGEPGAAHIKTLPKDAVLVAGYSVMKDMPPRLVSVILERTATIYEFRESTQLGSSLNEMPSFDTRMLAGLWVPSV